MKSKRNKIILTLVIVAISNFFFYGLGRYEQKLIDSAPVAEHKPTTATATDTTTAWHEMPQVNGELVVGAIVAEATGSNNRVLRATYEGLSSTGAMRFKVCGHAGGATFEETESSDNGWFTLWDPSGPKAGGRLDIHCIKQDSGSIYLIYYRSENYLNTVLTKG